MHKSSIVLLLDGLLLGSPFLASFLLQILLEFVGYSAFIPLDSVGTVRSCIVGNGGQFHSMGGTYLNLFGLGDGFLGVALLAGRFWLIECHFGGIQLFLFRLFFSLFLLLPLQELIGGLPRGEEIEMQRDEISQQKGKHRQNSPHDPPHHRPRQLPVLPQFDPHTAHNHMHDDHGGIGEGSYDAGHKQPIVASAHAVIEPHAVMVELVHAAVATAAVLAVRRTVAVAEFAEQHFAVVWGEGHLSVVAGPFVEVDHAVGRVAQGCRESGEGHGEAGEGVEDEQGRAVEEGERAGEVYGDGERDDGVGSELGGGGTG